MKRYPLYLVDLDGTVYVGRQAVQHAGSVITELLREGSQIRYLTNNSAARPVQVSAMLNHMGVPSKPEWVYGTGDLAVRFLAGKKMDRIFLVGEESFRQTLASAGIETDAHSPQAVLVGICRTLTYDLMSKAAELVSNGCEFIATNLDATYPLEGGKVQPGAGAVVAGIAVASGCQPIVLGKPEPALALAAMADACVGAKDALVVGDRLDTDIACGRSAGCDTFLVLTGVEKEVPSGTAGGPDLRSLL